ncbi:MAG: hypothetical protein JW965_10755 [Bacteroidales bacterium]|nr:hypothetical protein [Bacteroidales bacterium]
MEMNDSFTKIYKCDYCNNGISLLIKKLQEHPTSNIWLRYGRCCAACIATEEIKGIDKELLNGEDPNKSSHENVFKSGDHNTNILYSLTRAVEIEDETRLKNRKKATRAITAGNIVTSVSLLAGLIFFYYEYFTFALVALIIVIAGIVLCRLGVVKKCRIDKS